VRVVLKDIVSVNGGRGAEPGADPVRRGDGRLVIAAASVALVLAIGPPENGVMPERGIATRPGAAVPTSPFAGTPAEGFADGAAGVVLPRVRAVPGGTSSFTRTGFGRSPLGR
jgi:hypothetical protein